MKNQTSADFSKVDRDPRLFMAILTLVVLAMYVVTLVNVPEVRQPVTIIVFTLLIAVHITLHWFLGMIAERSSSWVAGYLILQGLLAFTISLLAGSVGMTFALFMGMIGESVGVLGLKPRGLLALVYYLILSMVSLSYLGGIESLGMLALGTVPTVLFVIIYVTLYVRQTEARTKAQALAMELEKANQQLSEYADRVEDLTIANERQRMARELHDTLSQGLAGLILQLEAADANLSVNHPEKARAIIQQTMDHARATLESSRRAIDNLRQPEPEGLEDAIRHEATHFSESTGIPCELHLDISHHVPETIREAVVRTISEALTNISLHAGAKHTGISAEMDEKKLEVTISDDGRGFDPAQIPQGHYGILGIRERIQLVGGTLEITSSPKSGTALTILIPIQQKES